MTVRGEAGVRLFGDPGGERLDGGRELARALA